MTINKIKKKKLNITCIYSTTIKGEINSAEGKNNMNICMHGYYK